MGFFSDINTEELGTTPVSQPIIPSAVVDDREDEPEQVIPETDLILDEDDIPKEPQVSFAELGKEQAEKKLPEKEPEVKEKAVKLPKKEKVERQPNNILVIPNGTVITGDVLYHGPVSVSGKITGSVTSDSVVVEPTGEIGADLTIEQDANILGQIKGNVSCKNLTLTGCKVKGLVEAKEHLSIESGATLVGDCKAHSVTVAGAVKGTITAEEVATLCKGAIIKGNVVAKDVVMERGARIQGTIERTGEEIDDGLFE